MADSQVSLSFHFMFSKCLLCEPTYEEKAPEQPETLNSTMVIEYYNLVPGVKSLKG